MKILLEAITSNNQDIPALIPTEYSCLAISTTAIVLAAIVNPLMAGFDKDSKKFNIDNKKKANYLLF